MLFNQFHDLAAGSGIGIIYKDAQKDYDVVRWSTNEIKAKALATVAENVDTSGDGNSSRCLSTRLVGSARAMSAWKRSFRQSGRQHCRC